MKGLFSVSGKLAVVTGASSGIGLMIARGLVEAGAKTYIVARNEETLRQRVEELSESGECIGISADLSLMPGLRLVADRLKESETGLDILINNAGVLWDMPIDDYTEEAWNASIDLNVKPVFFLTQQLLPLLRQAADKDDPSRIINIGSSDGIQVSSREHYGYFASKAGIHHLTRAMAGRLSREHITVNAIAPGPFPAGMTSGFPPEIVQMAIDGIPRGRFGTPEDIVGTVLYLASRAGAFTTAAVIPLDGGWSGAARQG